MIQMDAIEICALIHFGVKLGWEHAKNKRYWVKNIKPCGVAGFQNGHLGFSVSLGLEYMKTLETNAHIHFLAQEKLSLSNLFSNHLLTPLFFMGAKKKNKKVLLDHVDAPDSSVLSLVVSFSAESRRYLPFVLHKDGLHR